MFLKLNAKCRPRNVMIREKYVSIFEKCYRCVFHYKVFFFFLSPFVYHHGTIKLPFKVRLFFSILLFSKTFWVSGLLMLHLFRNSKFLKTSNALYLSTRVLSCIVSPFRAFEEEHKFQTSSKNVL